MACLSAAIALAVFTPLWVAASYSEGMLFALSFGPVLILAVAALLRFSISDVPDIHAQLHGRDEMMTVRRAQVLCDVELCKVMKWDVGHLYDYPYFSLGKYLVTTGERRALMIEYSGTRMPIFFGSFLLLVVGAPAGGLWVLFSLEASQQRLIILFAAILCPLSFISFHCGRMIFMILPRGVRAAAAVIRWQFLFTFMVPIIAGLTKFIVGGVNLHEDKVMLTTFCAIAVFPIACSISWMIMAIKHFEHISIWLKRIRISATMHLQSQVGFSAWLPSLCSPANGSLYVVLRKLSNCSWATHVKKKRFLC